MTVMVAAEKINKSFTLGKGKDERSVGVLKDLSLTVNAGEVVSVIGPSGSGKSTLLNCLAGLEEVDSGSVCLNGEIVSGAKEKKREEIRNRLVGFIFQDLSLVPSLSPLENVMIPARLRGKDISEGDALSIMAFLGIDAEGGKALESLSGGEKQRVAIARAIALDSQIIFADEPTGSLDSHNSQVVMGLLRQQAKENGRAVVVVTHDLLAASFSDRVVLLRDGSVQTELEKPSAQELISLMGW